MESNKKIYVNLRLKSTPSFADDVAPALLVICITFVLCCEEAVPNDQEKKEIGDGRKYNHKGYPSFQAKIKK